MSDIPKVGRNPVRKCYGGNRRPQGDSMPLFPASSSVSSLPKVWFCIPERKTEDIKCVAKHQIWTHVELRCRDFFYLLLLGDFFFIPLTVRNTLLSLFFTHFSSISFSHCLFLFLYTQCHQTHYYFLTQSLKPSLSLIFANKINDEILFS